MHAEAMEWVVRHTPFDGRARVLELGSRDLNGGVRRLFPDAIYWGIDIEPGPGVDEVADARTWRAKRPFDLVVCCEVFEHVEDWPRIVETASAALLPGGRAILTMATDPRRPHSGRAPVRELAPGEFYANVNPAVLASALCRWFTDWTLDRIVDPGDLRAVAVK